MTFQLTINGRILEAQEGMTVLEAARAHGISIPTLCHHQNLRPVGSCRLCLVEVAPPASLATACTLQVREGLVVQTETPGWWRCGGRSWNCYWRTMPTQATQREIARIPNLKDG